MNLRPCSFEKQTALDIGGLRVAPTTGQRRSVAYPTSNMVPASAPSSSATLPSTFQTLRDLLQLPPIRLYQHHAGERRRPPQGHDIHSFPNK